MTSIQLNSLLSQPRIIVLTGVQAAGKSTVARILAGRFERGVHVEADALQRMIVSGGAGVEKTGAIDPEPNRQLRLRLKNMCRLGISFYQAGFAVVLDDIIIGDRWNHLVAELQGILFETFVLAPTLDVINERDMNRDKRLIGVEWARYLDGELRATMTDRGVWIDNSGQTPVETVDHILKLLSRSESIQNTR